MELIVIKRRTLKLDDSIKLMRRAVYKGLTDPKTRELVMCVTRPCEARDDLCEVTAWFEFLKKNCKYVADPRAFDLFQTMERTLQFGGGDCFTNGTLVLNGQHELVPVESLRVGDRIWGQQAWSTVEAVQQKGQLATWLIELNNGAAARLTPGHKVSIAVCAQHTAQCSCPVQERRLERVRVRDLQQGMTLLQPERIPFGTGEMDPRRALIEGFYLSDGWTGHASAFDIAGRDGCPKEAQKREIEGICQQLGIKTYWHRKYIRVKNQEWTQRLKAMGTKARFKAAPSINFGEGAALALLRGILADSGKNTHGAGRTFTTTSQRLFVQTRVLLKMAGITCGERYIVDHGGAELHPIWRLQTRVKKEQHAAGRAEKLLRVKHVVKDGLELPCVDIQTSDHHVWLPEHDWTTAQCDDLSLALNTGLEAIGFETGFRVVQTAGNSSWSHVYAFVKLPKRRPTGIVPLDLTLANPRVGLQPPAAMVIKFKDYPTLLED